MQGKAWRQELEKLWSHCTQRQKAKQEQGMGPSYKTVRPTPVTHFLLQGSSCLRFYSIPKQYCHLLSKCSHTQAYIGDILHSKHNRHKNKMIPPFQWDYLLSVIYPENLIMTRLLDIVHLSWRVFGCSFPEATHSYRKLPNVGIHSGRK